MSAGSLLAAYRYPEVAGSGGDGLNPEQFLDGAANTL
jgi:organic hydroperoxide reductase OsmC/OhrA